MIARMLATGAAIGFTATALSGMALLVALDFLGEDVMLGSISTLMPKAAESQPPAEPAARVVEELPALADAKDITFFKEVPVEGTPFEVTTGVKFATPAALAANLVRERWCYIMARGPDGILRQVELAKQQGAAEPVFKALDELAGDLSPFLMSVSTLEALARSHCRFDFTSPAMEGDG